MKVLVGATAVANWSVDFYIVRVSELSGQFTDVLPQIPILLGVNQNILGER